jgi:hypothetical protein
MAALKMSLFTAGIALTACTSTGGGRPAANTAIQKDAAQEVRRICALPESEREAQIQKIREESGVVVACGKQ